MRARLARRDQLPFEVGEVAVRVAVALRLAEAHPVDDRRMVQRVGNDRAIKRVIGMSDKPLANE